MKILIADDEDYTREGLMESLDWDKLDIDEIMQARNGSEALNIAKWFKPDIVLTDIKMPKLDGIKFAQELVLISPTCKIIFMSGYMEIDYLKSAIQLSAIDYIEKPIDLTAIQAAINRAVNEIRELRKNITISENRKELQQQKLANLLILKEKDNSVVDSLCKEVEFPTNKEYICIIALDKAKRNNPDEVIDQIRNFLDKKGFSSLCNSEKDNNYLIILAYDKPQYYRLSSLYQQLVEYDKDIILGVGFEAESINNIYNSYNTAELAVNLSFYDEKSYIFHVDEEILTRCSIEPNIFGEFMRLLKEEPFSLMDWSEQLFRSLKEHKYYRKEQVQALLASLISAIFTEYPDLADFYVHLDSQEKINNYVHELHSLGVNRDFMLELIRKLEEQYRNQSKYSRIIRGSIDYIAANYSNPELSVTEIADYLHFTSTYMNVLFKQEMKVTLKQYLSNYRLDKAKRLLENEYYKITEIAEKCGYANANYFAKVFKEMTDMTPAEYRKQR